MNPDNAGGPDGTDPENPSSDLDKSFKVSPFSIYSRYSYLRVPLGFTKRSLGSKRIQGGEKAGNTAPLRALILWALRSPSYWATIGDPMDKSQPLKPASEPPLPSVICSG